MTNPQPPSSGPEPERPVGQTPPGQGPSGPGAYGSGPYGQAPYSQAPYGQAPDGQGGNPGYGPQSSYNPIPGPGPGPQGPGQPGPGQPGPGQGAPIPPYPGAYGPRPAGPPPRRSSGAKIAIIVGAGVVALILVVGVVAALAFRSDREVGSGGGSLPATEAGKASDAVQGYLEALAAGKAEEALAFGKEQPADKTFLTDAVLAESIKRAPITDITVPEVTDENAYQVAATYKIGGQAVNEKFYVSKEGDTFRLSETTQDVNLGTTRSATVPMIVNGTEVGTDKITLLPGSYAVTSGLKTVDYGRRSTFVITSPQDYARIELTPTLTKAGNDAFVAAAKQAVNACLAQKNIAPKSCPFGLRPQSDQRLTSSTIRWKLQGDPWRNLKPRLSFTDPAQAEASTTMTFVFTARGTQGGRPGTFGPQDVVEYVRMTGDVTKSPVRVRLG